MGCHFLLQGIIPTQGSNSLLLCLLHCRWILYPWATGEALEPLKRQQTYFYADMYPVSLTNSCRASFPCGVWTDQLCVLWFCIRIFRSGPDEIVHSHAFQAQWARKHLYFWRPSQPPWAETNFERQTQRELLSTAHFHFTHTPGHVITM